MLIFTLVIVFILKTVDSIQKVLEKKSPCVSRKKKSAIFNLILKVNNKLKKYFNHTSIAERDRSAV